jgi:hypothetical protein
MPFLFVGEGKIASQSLALTNILYASQSPPNKKGLRI